MDINALIGQEVTEDEVLSLTQRTRRALINDMIKDGMPTCNRDRRVLLELMNGADTTALGMKRLDNESDQAKADQLAAEAALKLIDKLGNDNPFEKDATVVADTSHAGHTLEQGNVIVDDIVEGELDVGLADLSYEEFMAEREQDEDEDDDEIIID